MSPAPTVTAVSPDAGTAGRRHQRHDHRHQPHRRDRGQVRRDRRAVVHRQQRHPDHRHRPGRAAGTVDVTVTTAGGTSADRRRRPVHLHVRSDRSPSISPTAGPARRRQQRHDHRHHLTGATAVKFGSTAASLVHGQQRHPDHRHRPGRAAGTVDITVTTAGGTSPTGAGDKFTYTSGPTSPSISPTAGPLGGGTSVIDHRHHLTGATAVKFGIDRRDLLHGQQRHPDHRHRPRRERRHRRRHVTTAGGTSPTGSADKFTYVAAPTVTSVSPTAGPLGGGNSVTITGTQPHGRDRRQFGSTAASSFTVNSATQITATAPAEAPAPSTSPSPPPAAPARPAPPTSTRYIAAPTITSRAARPSGPPTGGAQRHDHRHRPGRRNRRELRIDRGVVVQRRQHHADHRDLPRRAPGRSTSRSRVRAGRAARAALTTSPTPRPCPSRAPSRRCWRARRWWGIRPPPGFSGSVNPNGLSTTAYFEYKLDPSLGGPAGGTSYDQRTPTQTVGSDGSRHPVSAKVTGLVPNATYHVRLVATNSAGTSFGSDQIFRTAKEPPPPPPVLGKTENVIPVSGLVLIKPPPRTDAARDPYGAERADQGQGVRPADPGAADPQRLPDRRARRTLNIVTATGQQRHTQQATLGGGLFSLSQARTGVGKGLTTFNLLEGAFPGAPSYNTCSAHPTTHGLAQTAAHKPSSNVLQTLHASDNNGKFRTNGRYSAGTVRGTDLGHHRPLRRNPHRPSTAAPSTSSTSPRRKTIAVHAGHSYLAKATTTRKRKK